jgi:CRP-like cAMP-binding protein
MGSASPGLELRREAIGPAGGKKMERTFPGSHWARIKPKNRLLAALPDEVQSTLQPHMKTVSLPRGAVLCEADAPLARVYFVEAGAVSLVTIFEDGTTAEMATVGREAVVGIDTLLGGEHAFGRYVVAMPGSALTLAASRFRTALRESLHLRVACETYAQAFIAQLLQNVACNAAHTVEQRCARWLLMCADQTDDDTFELTHEYLAEMLGVRRSTVTVIASTLQQSGLIRYCRGSITVLNPRGLEAVACECHRVVHTRYQRLMAHVFDSGPEEQSA